VQQTQNTPPSESRTARWLALVPGALVALAVAAVSVGLAEVAGAAIVRRSGLGFSPVSAFLIAILLGIVLRNTVALPQRLEPGFRFCVSKVLRAGIILLGIRLSIVALVQIGVVAVAIVIVCVASAILVTTGLARRFGVSSRLGTLIAAGTSICGVSAVVAISPTIGAREEETSYAISVVTLFGVAATLLYPYLTEIALGLAPEQAGLFLGTAVHDTSQVTGAALIYDQVWGRSVSGVAIATKLVRNTLMVAVIPLLSIAYARRARDGAGASSGRATATGVFPVFVLGFVAMALFRSLGDVLVTGEAGRFLWWTSPADWTGFHAAVKNLAGNLLIIAIAAAGLGTDVRRLKQLSLRPLAVGLFAALVVGAVSLGLVSAFAGVIATYVTV
jgi:uncharacterized integral membrane protein (TIGR00698 family)